VPVAEREPGGAVDGGEGLQDPAADLTGFADDDLDGVEQAAAVRGQPVVARARPAAQVRAQRRAPSAGDDEPVGASSRPSGSTTAGPCASARSGSSSRAEP
jgi:hypothetical protein